MIPKLQIVATMPFHVVWLATNACNARCEHCSSASKDCLPNELRRGEVFEMLNQLRDAGVVDFAISGGEPLLRSDLFDIIAYAKRLHFSVGVGTNGSMVTAAVARRLADVQVDRVQVSLDGFAGSHDKLRRWKGLFERAVRAIKRSADEGLRTHICCTINRYNYSELERFTAFVAEKTPAIRLNFSRYVPTGRGVDSLDLDDSEWRSAIERCARLRNEYRGQLDIVTHTALQILVDPDLVQMDSFIGCQAGTGQACINAEGTVYPCVLLPIGIGNIRAKSFQEIWQTSAVIQALRARSEFLEPCGSCHLAKKCGGCRAVALAKKGDFLAADPRCWIINNKESIQKDNL